MDGKPRGNPNIAEAGRATRFKPGQVANPGGRPRGVSISTLIRNQLMEPSPGDPTKTKGEKMAETVVNAAVKGDKVWGPLVWRYMDGDPKTASELTLRELAEQLAERMGLDAKALLESFEREVRAA